MPTTLTDTELERCVEEKTGGHGAMLAMTWLLRIVSVIMVAVLYVYLVHVRRAAFAQGAAD